jgi:hypothetical protein
MATLLLLYMLAQPVSKTTPGPSHPPPNPCSNPIKCPAAFPARPATQRPGNGPRK